MGIRAKNMTLTVAATAVGGFIDYEFSGGSVDVDGVTTQASTSAEKDPGLVDFGQFNPQLVYDYTDAGQVTLQDSFENGTQLACVLTYPNGDHKDFNAFVTSYPEPGTVQKTIVQRLTMEITGPVVLVELP